MSRVNQRVQAKMSTKDERTRKGARTQTQMPVRLYEEERCMGTPETLPRHKTTDVQRRHKHTHKCSYVFMTRRGAWARPKRSLVTKRPNVQRRHKAHTRKLLRLYDEERCMGTPETLPRHKTNGRTYKKGGREQNTTQIIGWRKQHAFSL